MVLLIIIPIKWLFHWEYTLFSDIPRWIESINWWGDNSYQGYDDYEDYGGYGSYGS